MTDPDPLASLEARWRELVTILRQSAGGDGYSAGSSTPTSSAPTISPPSGSPHTKDPIRRPLRNTQPRIRKASSKLEEPNTFYSVSFSEVETWHEISRTAKTWKIERKLSHGHSMRRMLKSADIGVSFFMTPWEALENRAEELKAQIKHFTHSLQNRRTALGMVESELRRIEEGATVPARVQSEDASPEIGSATKGLSNV